MKIRQFFQWVQFNDRLHQSVLDVAVIYHSRIYRDLREEIH